MAAYFETVTNLEAQADVVRRRRYGVIEIVAGKLHRLRLRPFPKFYTPLDLLLRGERGHRWQAGDRGWLYYNQPRRFDNFLAVKFAFTSRDATLATARAALDALDEIARIKGTDALLCEVANFRISDRLLTRWGWASHKPQLWRRNYIKRFYGVYPGARDEPIATRVGVPGGEARPCEAAVGMTGIGRDSHSPITFTSTRFVRRPSNSP